MLSEDDRSENRLETNTDFRAKDTGKHFNANQILNFGGQARSAAHSESALTLRFTLTITATYFQPEKKK